jgi:TonB dependent receptor
VIVGGLRLDHYESNAFRPRRIAPDDSVSQAEFAARSTPRVADRAHNAISPRIQVAFPVSDHTAFRLSFAQQAQAPDFGLVLWGINRHPALPSVGSDLDYGKTISFEFGARHNFSPDLVLDLSAYYRNQQGNISGRLVSYYDGGKRAAKLFPVMTNSDYGFVRGFEVRLDMRRGDWWNGFVGYTYTQAQNTGSDPFSYYAFASNVLATLAGQPVQPPLRPITTIDSRPHSLSGSFAFTVPQGWHRGQMLGDVVSGVGVFGTMQLASGTPYTRCTNDQGSIGSLSGDFACSDNARGNPDLLGARLPMLKQVDIRLTKAFSIGRLNATAYLDVRNLFNFLNVVRVFTRTGNMSDQADRDRTWAGDSGQFASEALRSGHLLSDGSMDLRFGGVADPRAACGSWVTDDGRPNPVNCIYLIRAEERWGNGDHLFTTAEQRRASVAYYLSGFRGGLGAHRFTLPPRRLRIGFEIEF